MEDDDHGADSGMLTPADIDYVLGWVAVPPWLGEERETKDAYLAQFIARHGPPTLATFARLVAEHAPDSSARADLDAEVLTPTSDQDLDLPFALAALGNTGTETARAALVPHLDSPIALARWIATIALTISHDERAVPALERVLREFLPPDEPEYTFGGAISFYANWRHALPSILWEWQPPGAGILLRGALEAALIAEGTMPRPDVPRPLARERGHGQFAWGDSPATEAWFWYDNHRQELLQYQHDLVYGLGRVNALGGLAGLTMPEPADVYYPGIRYTAFYIISTADVAREGRASRFRWNLWHVHAAVGLLELEYTYGQRRHYHFDEIPPFAQAIERALEERFGLSAAARREAMADYERLGCLHRTSTRLMREWESRARKSDPQSE